MMETFFWELIPFLMGLNTFLDLIFGVRNVGSMAPIQELNFANFVKTKVMKGACTSLRRYLEMLSNGDQMVLN